MAHAQKPDFVFRRNGRVHLNRQGASVQSTTGRRDVHISLQGFYCSYKHAFCSHVTLTGCPLHSLFFPFTSPPVRHCVPSHFNWTPTLYDISLQQFLYMILNKADCIMYGSMRLTGETVHLPLVSLPYGNQKKKICPRFWP
jgi:hypothetical protein